MRPRVTRHPRKLGRPTRNCEGSLAIRSLAQVTPQPATYQCYNPVCVLTLSSVIASRNCTRGSQTATSRACRTYRLRTGTCCTTNAKHSPAGAADCWQHVPQTCGLACTKASRCTRAGHQTGQCQEGNQAGHVRHTVLAHSHHPHTHDRQPLQCTARHSSHQYHVYCIVFDSAHCWSLCTLHCPCIVLAYMSRTPLQPSNALLELLQANWLQHKWRWGTTLNPHVYPCPNPGTC